MLSALVYNTAGMPHAVSSDRREHRPQKAGNAGTFSPLEKNTVTPRNTLLMAAIFVWLAGFGIADAITCEECLKMKQERRDIERELQKKERDLKSALARNKYDEMKRLNMEMTEMRKRQMELQRFDSQCRDACKPDAVKEAECSRLKEQIASLEQTGSSAPAEQQQVDRLYEQLLRCNQDLRRIRAETR